MKLYYHKTSGGAEYLTDKFIKGPKGQKEGVFEGAKYIVRIDGDIRKDAEISVSPLIAAAPELLAALKNLAERSCQINTIQHSGGTVAAEDWGALYDYTNKAFAAINRAEGK